MINKKNTLILIFSILLVVIFIWGLIGSSQSANVGVTCDFGIGEDGNIFCWKWHKNVVGEIEDAIDLFLNK